MRPDETKARILAATDRLFGNLGFDATTTRDIAERSGVNEARIQDDIIGRTEFAA